MNYLQLQKTIFFFYIETVSYYFIRELGLNLLFNHFVRLDQRSVTWGMSLGVTGRIAADLLCIFDLWFGLSLIRDEEPSVLRVARVVSVVARIAVLRAPGWRLLCGLSGVIARGDPAGLSVRGLGPAQIRVAVLRHLRVHEPVCIRMIRWVEVVTHWYLPIRHSLVG